MIELVSARFKGKVTLSDLDLLNGKQFSEEGKAVADRLHLQPYHVEIIPVAAMLSMSYPFKENWRQVQWAFLPISTAVTSIRPGFPSRKRKASDG
nr:hypothetical protein [Bradyrhizobium sp. 157]